MSSRAFGPCSGASCGRRPRCWAWRSPSCSSWLAPGSARGPSGASPPDPPRLTSTTGRALGSGRTPTRAADQQLEAVGPPGGADQVSPERDVLMRGHDHGVVAAQLVGQPVDDALALRLEGAEQPVPDNEHAAVVAVEVATVHPVVYPVVGRRVHYRLDRPRQVV